MIIVVNNDGDLVSFPIADSDNLDASDMDEVLAYLGKKKIKASKVQEIIVIDNDIETEHFTPDDLGMSKSIDDDEDDDNGLDEIDLSDE